MWLPATTIQTHTHGDPDKRRQNDIQSFSPNNAGKESVFFIFLCCMCGMAFRGKAYCVNILICVLRACVWFGLLIHSIPL